MGDIFKTPAERDALAKDMASAGGWIYWPGGDAAPADWDGGVYLCRDGGIFYLRGYDWQHGTGAYNDVADWDRIGYRAAARKDRT